MHRRERNNMILHSYRKGEETNEKKDGKLEIISLKRAS